MIQQRSFNAYKKSGKFSIPMRSQMEEFVSSLPEGDYMMTIARKKRKRSIESNSYYWVVMTFIAKEVGYATAEELHSSFKSEFLTDRTNGIPIVRSTTKLQPAEFSEYLEKIIQRVASVGIIVPPSTGDNY